MKKYKLVRIANVPGALSHILKGQLSYINNLNEFEVIGVSLPGKELDLLSIQEQIRVFGVEMKRGISPFHDIISIWKLYKFFKIEKPQIVHSHTPKAGFVAMIASFFANVPVRVHTFTGLIFPSKKGLLRYILVKCDQLICICATLIIPEGKGVMYDLINNNVTKKKLEVLVNGNINGIDFNYYNRNNFTDYEILNFKSQLNITTDDFIFLYVGRILKDKGINELVKSFLEVLKVKKNIKLLIVGNFENEISPIDKEIEFQILNNPNIIYTGFQLDVRPYYAISDVFVLPSYREGFPNVVIQAGAMNLPSIVTNINGSNEIIIENINGLYVKSKEIQTLIEKMNLIIEDQKLLYVLKSNSRSLIVNRYSQNLIWDAIVLQYRNQLKYYKS